MYYPVYSWDKSIAHTWRFPKFNFLEKEASYEKILFEIIDLFLYVK